MSAHRQCCCAAVPPSACPDCPANYSVNVDLEWDPSPFDRPCGVSYTALVQIGGESLDVPERCEWSNWAEVGMSEHPLERDGPVPFHDDICALTSCTQPFVLLLGDAAQAQIQVFYYDPDFIANRYVQDGFGLLTVTGRCPDSQTDTDAPPADRGVTPTCVGGTGGSSVGHRSMTVTITAL